MMTIDPKETPIPQLFQYLTGSIGPRPIALASTVDRLGKINLAPFSFFNVFSANPPILVFSPARSGRDNTTKNTLDNVLEVPETVINIVNYAMVQQMSLSSTAYAKGVNEFVKAGFEALPSETITPPRVAKSPVQFECKVLEVKALGNQGGAGNLVICEVQKIHISERILDKEGNISPFKIDQVSRLGANWYSRANAGLFEVEKPIATKGVGVDSIPEKIKNSRILTGNDLGILGNVEAIPTPEMVKDFLQQHIDLSKILDSSSTNEIHQEAQKLIDQKKILQAWCLLLAHAQE